MRVLALLPFFLVSSAFAQTAGTPTGEIPNLVTTSGAFDSSAVPDMATLRIGVTKQAKTARMAQALASSIAQRLLDAAIRIVPDRKAYRTSDLSVSPNYVQPDAGKPAETAGYSARNVLTIRLDDLTKIGPMIDALTTVGANDVETVVFGLKEDKAAHLRALVEATRDAKAKAEALAAGLGLHLGDVYSVDEGYASFARSYSSNPFDSATQGFALGTPVLPGELPISLRVTVRFRLVK